MALLQGVRIDFNQIGEDDGKARYRGFYNNLPIVAVRFLNPKLNHPIQIVSPPQGENNLLSYYGFHVQIFEGVWTYFYIYQHYDRLLSEIFEKFPNKSFMDPNKNVINDDFTTIIEGCAKGLSNLKALNLVGHGILDPQNVALTFIGGKIASVMLTNMIGLEAKPEDDYVGLGRIAMFLFREQPSGYPEAIDFLIRLTDLGNVMFTEAYQEDPILILRHPIFWDACKILTFIYEVSGIVVRYEEIRAQEVVAGDTPNLEKAGAYFTSAINQIPINNWKNGFDHRELEEVRGLQRELTCDFIRGVRNLSAHNAQKEVFKFKFGRHPDEFYYFFRSRNKQVLIEIYKAVERHMRCWGGFPFTRTDCFDYWLIAPNTTLLNPNA